MHWSAEVLKCETDRFLLLQLQSDVFFFTFFFLFILPLVDDEGSASDVGKKFTKCSTCKYGAECDEDSEDVWWAFDLNHVKNEIISQLRRRKIATNVCLSWTRRRIWHFVCLFCFAFCCLFTLDTRSYVLFNVAATFILCPFSVRYLRRYSSYQQASFPLVWTFTQCFLQRAATSAKLPTSETRVNERLIYALRRSRSCVTCDHFIFSYVSWNQSGYGTNGAVPLKTGGAVESLWSKVSEKDEGDDWESSQTRLYVVYVCVTCVCVTYVLY